MHTDFETSIQVYRSILKDCKETISLSNKFLNGKQPILMKSLKLNAKLDASKLLGSFHTTETKHKEISMIIESLWQTKYSTMVLHHLMNETSVLVKKKVKKNNDMDMDIDLMTSFLEEKREELSLMLSDAMVSYTCLMSPGKGSVDKDYQTLQNEYEIKNRACGVTSPEEINLDPQLEQPDESDANAKDESLQEINNHTQMVETRTVKSWFLMKTQSNGKGSEHKSKDVESVERTVMLATKRSSWNSLRKFSFFKTSK